MSNPTLKALAEQIAQLQQIVDTQGSMIEALQAQLESMPKGRDRGPSSEGSMTQDDAIRCMIGDLREMNHKDAALELKLSYGQIYSARKGYTFKPIYKRMINGEVIGEIAQPQVEETPAEETPAAE